MSFVVGWEPEIDVLGNQELENAVSQELQTLIIPPAEGTINYQHRIILKPFLALCAKFIDWHLRLEAGVSHIVNLVSCREE